MFDDVVGACPRWDQCSFHGTESALARVLKHHLPCAFLPSAKTLTGANAHTCKFPKLSAIVTENSLKQPTEGRKNMFNATRGCAGFFPSTTCSHSGCVLGRESGE